MYLGLITGLYGDWIIATLVLPSSKSLSDPIAAQVGANVLHVGGAFHAAVEVFGRDAQTFLWIPSSPESLTSALNRKQFLQDSAFPFCNLVVPPTQHTEPWFV